MKFEVVIEETLTKVVKVEADSLAEAIQSVEDKYRESEIILGGDDFADYTVKGA